MDNGDIHWRSITRENVTSLYGKTADSRITDLEDPQRIFRWLLCESYDDKGNAILYEYKAEDSTNVNLSQVHERNRTDQSRTANRYLKRIQYGNRMPRQPNEDLALRTDWMFEVVFDYGEGHLVRLPLDAEQRQFVRVSLGETNSWPARADSFSSYRSGFEVRTYRLCQHVLMIHHFPAELGLDNYLVRSTEFSYDEGTILTYLTTATQSGYIHDETSDRFLCRSFPPVELEYSQVPLQNGVQLGDAEVLRVREIDSESLANLPIGLSSPYRFVDLDGEGVSGILTEQADTWYYKPNLGNGNFGPLTALIEKPSLAALDSGQQQLLDLAGDGQLDLAMFNSTTPGFYERTLDQTWAPFQRFVTLPNVDWDDPNLRFVDLTGDGHADLLMTEDDVFTWYPSLAEEGFGPSEVVRPPRDEEIGPRLILDDGTQSIYLADMSGDGLTDLVRIRNGEVCYWPSLGYGRFGPKVTMDNAPWFDTPDLFHQSRIRLADVDGSGITDIIYLGRGNVRLYYNQAGNGWSDRDVLPHFPNMDNLIDVQVTDLLGNGTACLVWSSPLPGDQGRQLRYVDLMNSTKPHLLIRSRNNLGAETVIHYTPSTQFYLADQATGTPWITHQPFPVHVVEAVETFDHISRNRFVSRYSYHHGYFDGKEREFRGFGRVDQLDTEEFATLNQNAAFPAVENLDAASHIPPVLTRSWYHTGVYMDSERISQQFAHEYYREPGLTDEQFRNRLLSDTLLPDEILSVYAKQEAVRALKGSMLRQEVYALDGSDQENHPYIVTEQNFTVEFVQPHRSNPYAVFFTHPRETTRYHYERNPADPRISHSAILEVDEYGNVLRAASIGYGRRQADGDLTPSDQAKQAQTLLTCTESHYTNTINDDDAYRTPVVSENRAYELTGLAALGANHRYSFTELDAAAQNAATIAYHETPTPNTLQKRLVEHIRILYRPDDLGLSQNDPQTLLSLGTLQSLALPGESYQLALTPDHANLVFGNRVTDAIFVEGGYVHTPDPNNQVDANWWIPSGRVFLSPDANDDAASELTYARQHFYMPLRFRDPFAATTTLSYDRHDLLPEQSSDPLDNVVGVRNDYRVLEADQLTDPNGNRSQVVFDALGMVTGAAVMGKESQNLGDSLTGFTSQLTQSQIDAFFADPRGLLARQLLGTATSRIIYDETRFQRLGADPPPCSATIARETHVSDLQAGEETNVQVSLAYSDGFDRVIQSKVQAEAGAVEEGGPEVDPRWVGSGWTIFNNKGHPVRQYEPFFDDTHSFRFGHAVGVSPTIFYDPIGRAIATLHPNHTWEKILFDPWRQEIWDVNDTVLLDPVTDVDVGDFFRRLPSDEYLPTWHAQRNSGARGADEQAAAVKAAAHAGTPTIAHLDSLGRTVLSIANNGGNEQFTTRTEFDIEDKQLAVSDALDREVMDYMLHNNSQRVTGYDMVGNLLFQHSMDAGTRHMLLNVVGNPLRRWNERGHTLRPVYDTLQRPTDLFVADVNGERLVQRTVYGEAQGNAQNHRGQIFQQFDGAGVITHDVYDFKENPLRSTRQFATNYRDIPDWSNNPTLNTESFINQMTYDALNRPVTLTTPDNSVIHPRYNEANLLETVEANLRGAATVTQFVNNIDYDSRGQRRRIEYGNGVVTEYTYDPHIFRLTRLRTTRGVAVLQDLHYIYDPVGNITSVRDDAQQAFYFNNAVVEPRTDYVYDALYRLTEATGREHIGQVAQPQISWNDQFRTGLPHPHNGAAMRHYREEYIYDGVGNILELIHSANNGNWTRAFNFNETSSLDTNSVNNRLTQTTISGAVEAYTYDVHGNMTSMPHLPQMDWDYADQLQQVDLGGGGTAFYQYDATGQRVRKVIERQNGTRTSERLYLGDFETYREFNGAGNTVTLERETLHAMDDQQRIVLVETRTQGNDGSPSQLLRYHLSNHLGSVILELDGGGQIISYEEYYPYGATAYQAVRSQVQVPSKRYRYTGKERDEESGFYYHGARYYAPWLGRWTRPDPLYLKDATNVYLYALNNPLIAKDPTGGPAWFVPVVVYLGYKALTSGGETAVEAGIAKATGDKDFSIIGTFAKNMVVNSTIGIIPGSTEAKIGVKAAIYGGKLTLRTTGDAALDTALGKGDFSDNLVKSGLGNVGGDAAGVLLKKGGDKIVEKLKGSSKAASDAVDDAAGELTKKNAKEITEETSKEASETATEKATKRVDSDQISGVPSFDKQKTLANPGEMQEAVRQLEGGFKSHLKDRPTLPLTHKLTELQQRGLKENIRNVLKVVDKRLGKGENASDVAKTLKTQLKNPRFRFLDQVPDAKQALLDSVGKFDDDLAQQLLKVLSEHGVTIPKK
ncbi:toxin [Chloroflexi bacterium TSY]|nr:toxin [Chloroflexi bacterium TSY]